MKATINIKDITGSTMNVITEIVSNIGYCYYDIPTFERIYGLSDKTIRRRIIEAQGKRDAWRYFIKVDGKNYVSVAILGFKKKNLIGKIRTDYIEFLGLYDWDIIGSLRPVVCSNVKAAKKNMDGFYKALITKFAGDSFVFFYVTEENPAKDGYHSHFVLNSIDAEVKLVKIWVKSYLSKYNQAAKKNEDKTSVHIENFDTHLRWQGLNYMTKQIEKYQDGYDLLSNVKV